MAKEMGHGGRSLVDRVYGNLGDIRHLTELVECRVQDFVGRVNDEYDDRVKELTG